MGLDVASGFAYIGDMATKTKKKRGRRGKYNSNMPLLAEGFARQGLSEKQIAKNLGVSEQTLNTWKNSKNKIEFLESLRRGQAPVDLEVENALLKRALGYTVDTEVVEIDEQQSANGNILSKRVKKKGLRTHIPGDTRAMVFWLTNRQRGKWQDKVVSEVDTNITIHIDSDDENL